MIDRKYLDQLRRYRTDPINQKAENLLKIEGEGSDSALPVLTLMLWGLQNGLISKDPPTEALENVVLKLMNALPAKAMAFLFPPGSPDPLQTSALPMEGAMMLLDALAGRLQDSG